MPATGWSVPPTALRRELELAPGESRRLALELAPVRLAVHVETADGAPAAGVGLRAIGADATAQAETDERGDASLFLCEGGEVTLVAVGPTGYAEEPLVLEPGARETRTLRLHSGERLTGEVVLADGLAPTGEVRLQLARREPWSLARSIPLDLALGRAPFELLGLPPGRYVVSLSGDGLACDPLELNVPVPSGALELCFEPARDD